MTEHPGWVVDEVGRARRAMRVGDAVWVLTSPGPGHLIDITLVSGSSTAPEWDVFEPPVLSGFAELNQALSATGPVARVRNADVWDAVATGVLRQVIRAGQARKLYSMLCARYGERVQTPAGPVALFPLPEVVGGLSEDEFAELGLSFKRTALLAAATAVRDRSPRWTGLSPGDLVRELRSIHRIGPWTAGAAVADLTNDFAYYPYADLAVRTWAARLAPLTNWPDSEGVMCVY